MINLYIYYYFLNPLFLRVIIYHKFHVYNYPLPPITTHHLFHAFEYPLLYVIIYHISINIFDCPLL